MSIFNKNAAARCASLIAFLTAAFIRGPQGLESVVLFTLTLLGQTAMPHYWSKAWQSAVANKNRRLPLAFIRAWRRSAWLLAPVPLVAAFDVRAGWIVLAVVVGLFALLVVLASRDSARPRSGADDPSGVITEEDIRKHRENARFLLHIGDGVEAAFQVDLWYYYTKAIDPSMILVIRSDALYRKLRATRPELYVEYVKAGLEAEKLVSACPKLTGVLYVSNTGNTVHFLRLNHLRHVFVGHGDSEKAASCHKFFRAYDEVWTAGLAHIDRFKNSGLDFSSIRFRIVGRPTMRGLLSLKTDGSSGKFLYLPTWEGFQADQEYTSLAEAGTFIPDLVKLCGRHAVIKLHPLTGKRNPALLDVEQSLRESSAHPEGGIQVVERNKPVTDTMADSDFLVADISSVVSDYLTLGRPIFLHVLEDDSLRRSTSSMPPEAYCYTFSKPSALLELVDRVILKGDDYLRENRERARQYFVDVERTLGCQFEKELRAMVALRDNPPKEKPAPGKVPPGHRPWLVGHRGAKGLHPENSLSGFRAAAAMDGLDAVELDLHLSADDELVVIHDPLLNRTTNGSGPVSNFRLEELRRLSLKHRQHGAEHLVDETIPTLDEVLDILVPSGKEIHIELKNDAAGRIYQNLAPRLLDIARKRGILDRCVFTSFLPEVLEDIRRRESRARLLASISPRSAELLGGYESALARFERCGECLIALEAGLFKTLLDESREFRDFSKVAVWVVNDEKSLRRFRDLGVKQITTDRPDLAIPLLKPHV